MIPANYCLTEIEVPDDSVTTIKIKNLPESWKDILPPVELKRIGDEFLKEQAYLLMKVPSSIVPKEYNYLLNTRHPGMKEVSVIAKEVFNFDLRLV